MKTLTPLTLALLLSITASAQTLTYSFFKIKEDVALKIGETHHNLLASLSRTGFTNADTIDVTFNYRMEYELVRHNLQDPGRIENLYRNIVLHASMLKVVMANSKFMHFRIYVRLEKDRYLFTDLEDISLTPMVVRIPDREFNR
jgi:hypothetical protein